MSDENQPETPLPPAPAAQQVERMEDVVFDRIGDQTRRRRARRGRIWAGAAAAVAVVTLAALIGPALTGGFGSSGSSVQGTSLDGVAIQSAPAPAAPLSADSWSAKTETDGGVTGGRAASGTAGSTGREIVATGSVTLAVDDPAAAVPELTAVVVEMGGYVESSTVGNRPMPADSRPADASMQVRVPSASLQKLLDRLPDFGDATASSISRSDVTDQAVDLRARIDAAQTSVTRLTQLMGQAGSVADLLTAEKALSERQAELESLQQRLAALEGQVQMSSVSVQLTARTPAVEAQPAGFLDGLLTGWNGLVVTLNGIVIGLGFLLPWLVIAAVVVVVVWGVRRMRRIRRARAATPPAPPVP